MENDKSLSPSQCAKMLGQSRSTVVLTGAGISTAAGIPDFRGPEGLYVTRRYDPVRVFEIESFYHEPQFFYEFSRDFVATAKTIRPTWTHRFLARLEDEKLLTGIVTQNIDLLHHQAGSRQILELHGSYDQATCINCGAAYWQLTYEWWERMMAESSTPPVCRCLECEGVLKPGIVFFGEMVHQFSAAENLVAACDLLLVLGSSLQVVPASHLPYATDAATIVVNQGEVALPPADNRYFIESNLDAYFEEVSEYL